MNSATNYDDAAHQIDIRIAGYSSLGADTPDSTLLQPGATFVASATLPWPVNMATIAEVDGNEALATTYIFNTGLIPSDTWPGQEPTDGTRWTGATRTPWSVPTRCCSRASLPPSWLRARVCSACGGYVRPDSYFLLVICACS